MLLYENDSQHLKAKSLNLNIANTEIHIPEYILIEVVSILKQKNQLEVARSFVQKIMIASQSMFIPSYQYFTETQSAFLNTEKNNKLSFIDTSLLVLSKEYTIITFDKQLQKEIQKLS